MDSINRMTWIGWRDWAGKIDGTTVANCSSYDDSHGYARNRTNTELRAERSGKSETRSLCPGTSSNLGICIAAGKRETLPSCERVLWFVGANSRCGDRDSPCFYRRISGRHHFVPSESRGRFLHERRVPGPLPFVQMRSAERAIYLLSASRSEGISPLARRG